MKKKSVKTSINEMKRFATNMPKSINEVLQFEGDDEMGMEDDMADEEMQEEPSTSGIDVEKYIDSVRKTALKGMAQLADDPENWGYQTLKKLWQICDKKPEEGQQMQQPMQQQQRPRM